MLKKFDFLADLLGGRHTAGLLTGANQFLSVISAFLNEFKDTY